MALERKFVKEGIRNKYVEEFLANEFSKASYSHCEIQRTPLSIRITVYAHKPGLIIGRGGKNIENMTQYLKDKFGFENPQLDVQEVASPDLDPFIISRWIASAIERGLNYKRVANIAIEKVMNAGAAGIAIRIGGKLGSDMSRVEKFSSGYLKYSGDMAETLVKKAYAQANVKLGTIGIQVRILPEKPVEIQISETQTESVKKKEAGEKVGNIEEKTNQGNDAS